MAAESGCVLGPVQTYEMADGEGSYQERYRALCGQLGYEPMRTLSRDVNGALRRVRQTSARSRAKNPELSVAVTA